jgi:cytoskeleton protein RodZ
MKSLGDTLMTAREERGISMDQAVHETNISRNYLEALENESFEEFPAEAYLVGFLRNYADFLGLDPDKIVGQYKNYKLSEEPTPIEELVGPPKGSTARKILPWAVLIVILAAGGLFGIPRLATMLGEMKEARAQRVEEAEAPIESREIHPAPPLWEGEVRPTDVLVLEGPGGDFRLDVSFDGNLFEFTDDGETWSMLLGEEIYLPGADGKPAWRMYLKDMGLPGNAGILEIQQLAEMTEDEDFVSDEVVVEPPSGQEERRREPQVILSAERPDRYTLDIAFRDFCLFRYKVDNQDPLEAYYSNGENFRLDIGRTLTLWASNAGALYAKIGGEEVALGSRGEVVVGQIRWILDEESGEYDLSLVPLY